MSMDVQKIYDNFMTEFGFDLPEFNLDPVKLRETGIVTETETTEDGFITKKIDYLSNDGTTQISQTVSYNKNYLINKENREIRKQITKAVAEENYELAAELKAKLRKK